MKITIALIVAFIMGGSVVLASTDTIQQITFENGKNCQVSTIAGQTYVNC